MNKIEMECYKILGRMPVNNMTEPLYKKALEKLGAESEQARQALQRQNWEYVMLYEKLKKLIEDGSIPKEKMEDAIRIKEETAKKIGEAAQRIAELDKL